jgi:hypothetical protein
MATPNYGWEKRQRELAKKRKKEEKAQRKAAHKNAPAPAEDASSATSPARPKDAEGEPAD